jgi:Collagen triple helix repeat (20 copies)
VTTTGREQQPAIARGEMPDVRLGSCPSCAAEVGAADRFCPVCGVGIVAGADAPTQQIPTAAQEAAPSATPSDRQAPVLKQHTARTLAAAIILSSLIAMLGAVALSSTAFSHAGPVGPRGAVGTQGTPGPIGKPGPPGARGRRGAPGLAGSNGTNGANGAVVTAPASAQQTGTDSAGYAYGVNASGVPCSDNPNTPQPNCPF